MSDLQENLIKQILGPIAHRVYQRDDADVAEISLELILSAEAEGKVEVRTVSSHFAMPWRYIGHIEAGSFKGKLTGVPVGQHRLEIRIMSNQIKATASIDPVFVGDLWILAGQSNMEGCGKLTHMEPEQVGISCFYMGDRWDIASEPLCWLNESVDSVHWLVPESEREQAAIDARHYRTESAGLGIPFAKEVFRYTGVPIGLIMCARGATDMTEWDPALLKDEGRSLYGSMIRRIRQLGGKVKGCLWYQGESDAIAKTSHLYRERTLNFIDCLRRDLDDQGLPFIYAQLSVFYIWEPDASHWNCVQQEQYTLEALADRIALVPTIDSTMSNAIHLDAVSLMEVGRRMAWQALRLAYSRQVSLKGPRPNSFIWNENRNELTISMNEVNGYLDPIGRVFGFRVEVNGKQLPLTALVANDKQQVLLRFEQSIPHGAQLWHGRGYNPTVNVKDAKGIPLVVFGPVTI
jgi:sialate O-acetylesterase